MGSALGCCICCLRSSRDSPKKFRDIHIKDINEDLEEYRNGYPGLSCNDPEKKDNYLFYTNRLKSQPHDATVDQILFDWFGDYEKLELYHGYIQWLFPVREAGMNSCAQVLQEHEIESIKSDPAAYTRVLQAYKLMLHFCGMKLVEDESGTIERNNDNWKDRFRNLNGSYHNYMRITRILKSLGELGYEHLKPRFVIFILEEIFIRKQLTCPVLIESCINFWLPTLKDLHKRNELWNFAMEKLDYKERMVPIEFAD